MLFFPFQPYEGCNIICVCLQAHAHNRIAEAWVYALGLQASGMSLPDIRRIDEELLPASLLGLYDEVDVSLLAVSAMYHLS
jgi:hypothetical protein